MTTWFTSDLHLGHRNIIKYCARPWGTSRSDGDAPSKADVEEMNHALIVNNNASVSDDDVVYDLGDAAFTCTVAQAVDFYRQLKGRRKFLPGNHDDWLRYFDTHALLPSLSLLPPLQEIQVEGQSIVLCHYPLEEWRHCNKGSWHLHGHVHGLLRSRGKRVDVGVDNVVEVLDAGSEARGHITGHQGPELYRPVSFEEVAAFMATRPIGPHVEFQGYAPSGAQEKEK